MIVSDYPLIVIKCDSCGMKIKIKNEYPGSRTQARWDAKKKGWQRVNTRVGKKPGGKFYDLCRACNEAYQIEKREGY